MKKTKKLLALTLALLMLMTSLPLTTGLVAFAKEGTVSPLDFDSIVPETPDGYTNVGIVAYDENGIPIYQFEKEATENGLINQLWLTALGEEVADPLHEAAYPEDEHLDRGEDDLPEAYDARDYNLITPVEYQIGGTCWAHAAAACLETNFIKKGYGTALNTNLCEYHIAWYSRNSYYAGNTESGNDGYTVADVNYVFNGGNPAYVERALSSYSGAAYESNIGITATTSHTKETLLPILQEKLTYDKRYTPDIVLDSVKQLDMDNAQIKQGILDYGAVFITYYSSGNGKEGNPVYYNYTKSNGEADYWYLDDDQIAAYYCPVETETDHAVTVVGWDDNFPKENFVTNIPEGDGAWLIKNSWSEYYANDGYIWISYYDKSLARPYVFSAEDPDLFDTAYIYDGANYLYDRGGSAYANIFTAKNNEYLTMINSPKQAYTLKVYKNLPENTTDPTAGTLVHTQSGPAPTGKYVAITGDIPLTAGERYSVVIEGSKIYYENTGDTKTSKVGDSFYKDADGNWQDSSADGYGNVGIRAFTSFSNVTDSYKVVLTDGNSYEEILYSENGTVTLPTKENHTYIFTYGGETFDGTGVTRNMYVETHCYPTNGVKKGETPCTTDYECIYCGKAIKESITNHSYQESTIAPSPTEIGRTSTSCSVCGESYTEAYTLYSGAVGGETEGMWWQYYDGNLVVLANGSTPDYESASEAPWSAYASDILRVYVKEGTENIGDYLLADLPVLSEAYIADSVKSIGEYAFSNAANLASFLCPAELTTISRCAFNYCGLTDITYNSKLTSIESYAFNGCKFIEAAIPGTVKNVPEYVFYGCSNLKKITLEEGVQTTYYLVWNTPYFEELVIPSTLRSGIFMNYSALEKYTVHPDNQYYCSVDGVLFNKAMTSLVSYPCDKADLYYEVPDSVTSIGQYAFSFLDNLRYLDLPETELTLGLKSFNQCHSLAYVNLPDSLKSIGNYSFSGTVMSSLFVPSGVTSINPYSFNIHNANYYVFPTLYTDSDTALIKSYADENNMTCITTHTEHDFSTVVQTVPNGCETIKFKTCECGRFVREITDNHSFAWVIDKAATCGATGIKHEECSICHAKRSENTVINATGAHDYAKTVIAPTCTDDGYTIYDCKNCEHSYNGDTVATSGHDYQWVIDKAATCGATGIKHEECSVCHIKRSENTVINATGAHDYAKTVIAPTCTDDGYTIYDCKNCEHSYNGDTVATSGHDYKWAIDKAATCIEAGIKHEECSACKDKRSENTAITATGVHSYTSATVKTDALKKDATCTNAATYYYSCSVCGKVEKNDNHTFTVGSALPHGFEWIIDRNATCGVNGIKHEECSVCKVKRNENTSIPATGNHDYVSTVIGVTCTADGYTLNKCSVCGNSYKSNTVASSGHSYGEWVSVTPATCTSKGSEKRECSECDSVQNRDTFKDHSYTIVPGKAATCGEAGYTDYSRCGECGTEVGKNVLPATGNHTDTDGNGKCDTCGKDYSPADDCDCICHNDNAFVQFIFKIVNLFWKLFKMNQTCECGNVHY